MVIKFLEILSAVSFIMGFIGMILGKKDEAIFLVILSFVIDNKKEIIKIEKGNI